MRFVIVLSFYISILLPFNATADESHASGFKTLCSIFKETLEINIDLESRSNYLATQVNSRIENKDVVDSYNVIFNISPNERYPILQEAVKHYTGKDWQCDAARVLLTDE